MKTKKKFSFNLKENITDAKLLIVKGLLFLLLGVLSALLLILRDSSFTTITLLVVAIWSSMKFYQFMFYVITNYVDSNYKDNSSDELFSGLMSFVKFFLKNKKKFKQ
jgi:hypothetical protein